MTFSRFVFSSARVIAAIVRRSSRSTSWTGFIMNRIGRRIKDINAARLFQNLMEQTAIGNIDFCEPGAKFDKVFSAFFGTGYHCHIPPRTQQIFCEFRTDMAGCTQHDKHNSPLCQNPLAYRITIIILVGKS